MSMEYRVSAKHVAFPHVSLARSNEYPRRVRTDDLISNMIWNVARKTQDLHCHVPDPEGLIVLEKVVERVFAFSSRNPIPRSKSLLNLSDSFSDAYKLLETSL
jgi:hypothetical protein